MADAPKKSGGANALTKKAGPLPRWGWVAVGGGAYLVYRFLKARSAAASNTAASGTTGGTLIPNDIGLPSTSTAAGQGSFSSVASWTQAALDFGSSNGLDPGTAFNQIQAYLNGNCVSQAGYNFLSSAFANTSIGLPPAAFSTAQLPTLSVCPAPQQTPTTSNPSPSSSGGTATATITNTLAQIDATAWPSIVKFGQDANAGTDFTQIGVVNNGVYSGKAAKAGAPVWAGVLGGYAQGTNFSTLPNGTIIYGASTLNNQGYYG
jgi:hypothetical protein